MLLDGIWDDPPLMVFFHSHLDYLHHQFVSLLQVKGGRGLHLNLEFGDLNLLLRSSSMMSLLLNLGLTEKNSRENGLGCRVVSCLDLDGQLKTLIHRTLHSGSNLARTKDEDILQCKVTGQ